MLNNAGQKWLHSVVTLKDGYSYSIRGKRFVLGRPTQVTCEKTRRALSGNPAFHIADFWEKPASMPVVETPVSESEPESKPRSEPKLKLKSDDEPKPVVQPLAKTVKVKTKVKKKEDE